MKASSFIDELLAEQQQLTAVERFAQRHVANRESEDPIYRELIPLERPRPGEQYAFQVDLDLCTGCKACVSACHSLNGLDEDETWRAVGLLHGGSPETPYQQTVTSACHHCVDPACLNGCPVLAYEKDETTGIVHHLDDQCIGCQYCVLKCPYDVPKYSSKRGIVRKCDLCHSRLAVGEAPACAQACPSSAITIQIVSQDSVRRASAAPHARLLPGSFPSGYTLPATNYVSSQPIPENCRPANVNASRPEPAHWPLVWMLVFTQMASGAFLSGSISFILDESSCVDKAWFPLSVFGSTCLLAGLAASIFHLGRPLGAWRALLGLRRSWMSREILAFMLSAAAALGLINTHWHASFSTSSWMLVTSALGLVSVFCSGMIYVDTRRPAWVANNTFTRFFGTTLLLGATGTTTILSWIGASASNSTLRQSILLVGGVAIFLRTFLFIWESQMSSCATRYYQVPGLFRLQTGLFVLATFFGIAALINHGLGAACLATSSFLVTFTSRILERYEFFVTAATPRIPGTVAS